MGYVFKEVTQQLTNGNAGIHSNGILRYGNKVYFTTVAGGYCYLVEVDRQGNSRSLQLFENDYSTLIGEDDYHGAPAIEWIEEGSKILAVGGGHNTQVPMKWAVVDVENWNITASGDFGTEKLTYPVLIKTSDGKITLLIRKHDDDLGYKIIIWYEFDPSSNTWSSPVQVTSTESLELFRHGINIDNGRIIIGLTVGDSYFNMTFIQFDPSTKKFYDLAGNELSLPFDHSTWNYIAYMKRSALVYNNYLYGIKYDDANQQLVLVKIDSQYNVVASKVLASPSNTAYLEEWQGAIMYYNGELLIAYRNNNNKLEIDTVDPDTLDTTKLYESASNDIPVLALQDNLYDGVFIWYDLINTDGSEDWNIEASDDHITYIIFIDPAEISFKITSYPSSVSGTPSSIKTIDITVENQGTANGDCTVRIRDHNNNVVAEQTKTIVAGSSETYSLQITLPSTTGTYTWTIEAYNVTNDTVDDTETFTVSVQKKKGFPWWILLLGIIGIAIAWKYQQEKEKQQLSS